MNPSHFDVTLENAKIHITLNKPGIRHIEGKWIPVRVTIDGGDYQAYYSGPIQNKILTGTCKLSSGWYSAPVEFAAAGMGYVSLKIEEQTFMLAMHRDDRQRLGKELGA